MQLSPLQSRLAASLVASCLLILLYLLLFPPNFALAAELEHSLPAIFDGFDSSLDPAPRGPLDPTYEPEFAAFDRSILGRAPSGFTSLTNNQAMPMNVDEGTTQLFVFALPTVSGRETVEARLELRSDRDVSRDRNAGAGAGSVEEYEIGRKKEAERLAGRQATRTVYISVNTCEQPQPVDPSKTTLDPPQLTLFVSRSKDNRAPGPPVDRMPQDMLPFTEGAAMYSLTTDGDVYIGVHAPNVSEVFSGTYNFKIAASTDSYYYSYNDVDDADLIWVDSDSQGALLVTHDLTDSTDPGVEAQIMSTQPYVLFAHNKKDRAINGLKHSYCGLQNYAQIAAIKDGRRTSMVMTGMTRRGPRNLPKQQFFFSGLNSSAEYIGILARDGSPSSASKRQAASSRGTQVFKATNFSTKSNHGNCALVVDLPFCDQVAYSVPSNPNFGNATKLAQFYDTYASTMYTNFNKSLAQIACEAPSNQRYSLARNCTDCAAAYKDWLCSVTIPRCEDFSSTAPYLQPRAVSQPFPDGETLDAAALARLNISNSTSTNSSRNQLIDEVIRPGPYRELLPCDNLCYKLVQSCPAAMKFGCPKPEGIGFEGNYARHDPSNGLTCNFPGSAHFPSRGSRAAVNWRLLAGVVIVGFLAG